MFCVCVCVCTCTRVPVKRLYKHFYSDINSWWQNDVLPELKCDGCPPVLVCLPVQGEPETL